LARCGLSQRGAALGSTREDLSPFLLHQFLLRCEGGIRIQSRNQIPIPLKQTRRDDTSVQIGAETFCYGNVGQVRLFENLPADPSFLGQEALQLHHKAGLFVQDFEELVRGGRHAVEVV
jgi:hypothetical protein